MRHFFPIVTDPSAWSRADLGRWIRWTMQQFNIPDPDGSVARAWDADEATADGGRSFLQLSEQDFRSRMPQVSSNIDWQSQSSVRSQ